MGSCSPASEPIAIIGTGCRFPGGCDNPSKLWDLLRQPRDLRTEIPDSRFSVDGFYHPDNAHHGTSNVRHSYLLDEDLRRFDAAFFGIKPIEANALDPQQRLLLETVYESLEAAGLTLQQLQGSDTAVYVGVMSADYTDLIGRDLETFPTYFATGTARSILSNRLSHFFDWHGPSLTLDTACSSSLIALHHAVQTLRSGDSSLAVVAGANLILGPEQYIAESKLQMLSPTGRSRMWDAAADGYARGEGVAAIVLKRLSQAVADGDHIECIVRETGVNQDGKTPGITMPSTAAQAALIRATYARAGLDLAQRADRPQFFEAHGTGTPAGDPIEARAIRDAFFGDDLGFTPTPDDTLFVGSIKTVIGHTEGTAGLAAVIKASLALQAGVVPPNRLLDQLNPAIKPYYTHLRILSAAADWPPLRPGAVHRASVNSFGFGGANAHAILERYDSPEPVPQDTAFTPFTFSAATDAALRAILHAYRDFLSARPALRPADLAWTLNTRRITLSTRIALAAPSIDRLIDQIDGALEATDFPAPLHPSSSAPPRILGIFTGQGAQWARMGAALLETSPSARALLAQLDHSLHTLPDPPTWSLHEQLLAAPAVSRIADAALSQPLCTALQILLVDLLRQAGIHLAAVVGHSSGEIAAAYAAGCLSAADAIRVAYYRGLHLRSAAADGAMLAAGTTPDDARDLCALPAFAGRVCLAATNSATSVTLSGDADAIDEVRLVLDDERKFARRLKVDRAYHSHHMRPCIDPYVRALQRCRIRPSSPPTDCRWVSSVFACPIADVEPSLADRYWGCNLAQPVLFADALRLLLELSQQDPFHMALEIGPHPALQGPASQTIQEVCGESLPYSGVLRRGQHDGEAFAAALGAVWTHFPGGVDFARYAAFMSDAAPPRLVTGLPTYPWDHGRVFWHESRVSRALRTQNTPPHELLGRMGVDGAPDQRRWRNVLKPREVGWLEGHRVQGQMVFPCAGYVVAAVEAGMRLAGKQGVRLVELEGFVVGQAMVFDDEGAEVETLVSLTGIVRAADVLTAEFAFYSAATAEALELTVHASGRLRVVLGESVEDLLPSVDKEEAALAEVEPERFYAALGQLGFGYSGPFRALGGLKRRLGWATGVIGAAADRQVSPLVVHPATLDAAIQAIMLAYCFPGDSMLRGIQLPTGIDRLTVNPANCAKFAGRAVDVPFEATACGGSSRSLQGDVNIYSPDGARAVQLEGLQTQPLAAPTEATDLNIFTELVWGVDRPDCDALAAAEDLDAELLFALERVAYYYLRSLDGTVPVAERGQLEWHHQRLFAYVDHVLATVNRGVNRFARAEWNGDSKADILQILNRYPDNIDLRLMRAVGENLPAVVRGQLTMLEPMMQDNMLNEFYVAAHGMQQYTRHLAALAGQISHGHPHMRVLEIGAGTGGATKSFLRELGDGFASYTFSDISSGFFETAAREFAAHSTKMSFQVLDIEKEVEDQGFAPQSFDLVIASLVLHATTDLARTLRNVRALLKPGGYLLLLEITETQQMRFGLIFGGLPGWWLGYDDGRPFSPCVGLDDWAALLTANGFSGIDTAVPHHDTLPVPLSVLVSQAVDDRVQWLRAPLQSSRQQMPRLTVVGGGGRQSITLAKEIARLLQAHYSEIRVVDALQAVHAADLPVSGSVLCLADLDEPVFKAMTPDKLRGYQDVFKQSKNVLWMTQGSRSGDPYARMVVGFGRTIVLEMLHLRLQFMDIAPATSPDARVIADALLRLELTGVWEEEQSAGEILYAVEPELFFDQGKYYVPRFRPNREQNHRYNASRRHIETLVEAGRSAVEIVYREGSASLVEVPRSLSDDAHRKSVEIQVTHSISRAVEVVPGCYLFCLSGRETESGDEVVALSPTQSSRVRVPRALIVPRGRATGSAEDGLRRLYTELLARSAMKNVPPESSVIALDPRRCLAESLQRISSENAVTVNVWTTYRERAEAEHWQFLHSKASKTEIVRSVPREISCVLDMSQDQSASKRLIESLPEFTQVKSERNLTRLKAHLPLHLLPEIRSLLVDVGHALKTRRGRASSEPASLALQDFVQGSDVPEICLIQWDTQSTLLPVQVQPIESQVRFQSDKTYWLVGLTGGLGLSLCEWMAQQGARFIVLTSRNPQVDPRWLEKMKAMGVTVEVKANDICDRESVQSVYRQICEALPPIAGVAQGAMVLHDTLFLDLDMARMNKVLDPKVRGATYLEEIFRDTDLDFFVFLSSMAAVTGNPGQSAYAAANMFMASLVTQRRARGLNASAVHIGAIFGNGYVTRELTLAQQEFLRNMGNLWLSEHDFRTLFGEAVLAGRHDRGRSPEISTGLKIVDSDDSEAITWLNDPKFQHCIKKNARAELVSEGPASSAPAKVRLAEAVSSGDVFEIISDAFIAKLKTSLQVEDDRPIVDLTADKLGIDSLVAVDIRSWFIKELQVEIPVLKILSGATVRELLVQAQELLPSELIPKFDPSATSSPSKPKQTPKPPKSEPPVLPKIDSQEPTVTGDKQLTTELKTTAAAQPSKPRVTQTTRVESTIRTTHRASPSDTATEDPGFVSPEPSSTVDADSDSRCHDTLRSGSPTSSWSEIDESEAKPEAVSVQPKQASAQKAPMVITRTAPMAFAQSRFWFLRQYLKDPATFNITVSIQLDGNLNVDSFARAVRTVGQRHEALRTRFVTDNTQNSTEQQILSGSTLSLEQRAVSDDDEADTVYQDVKQHAFHLEEGENMRILLLQKSPASFRLIIAYHHINMDGVSLEVFLRDLQTAYDAKFLSPRVLQFADFAQQQRREYDAGDWADDLAFWKQEFETLPAPLPLLPMAQASSRSTLTAYATNLTEFHLDAELLGRIQDTCKKLQVTAFHFHLAVFYTLLSRLVDVEDLCIGISSANRFRPDMLQSIGMYLNLLPLQLAHRLDQTFINALHLVREKSLNAFTHAKVPFDVLLTELGAPRSATHSPLFQVLVNYRAGVSERRQFCDCTSRITAFEQGQAPYDLSLDVIDNPGGDCHVLLAGQSALYDAPQVDVLGRIYRNLLTAFARNPALRLNVPSLYEAPEVERAIQLGRGPSYAYQWAETIPARIDDMVQRYSSHVALIDGSGVELSYGDMDERTNALAVAISKQGMGHGSRIGVFLDPGSDWICSLLAILRLDATYIPLDRRMGLDRLAVIVEDCKPDLILIDEETESDLASLKFSTASINISTITHEAGLPRVPNAAHPDSTAAIIYTSGSTGVPKGIVMTHHTFRNNIESSTAQWDFRPGHDTNLQQSSYSFDMSLSQVFLTLSNGGTLRVVPKHLRGDPQAISSLIARGDITFTEATPSEYLSWLRYGDLHALRHSQWRVAVSGGEAMTDNLIQAFRKLQKPDLQLIDCYGPTEITFCSHSRDVPYHEDQDDVSPGLHTWPNYSVYIMDRQMKPVPTNIPGEVLIGGAGVVAGYLHSELNSRGFGRDRCASPEFITHGWTRFHRTGDVGRLDDRGRLILGGRIAGDTQVKHRGIRMDLREIESAILRAAQGTIVDAAVVVRDEALVAFVTLVDSEHVDSPPRLDQIRHQLPLPQYMRPAALIPLRQMPTTTSHKIDRLALQALPLPSTASIDEPSAEEPESVTRMRRVWETVIPAEILSQFALTPASDFFHTGGDSMLLVRLQAEIQTVFQTPVSLFQLFDASTLEAMAALVAGRPEQIPAAVIDWETETALSPSLRQLVPAPKRFIAHPEVVILTGATGFLGRAILARLLKDCGVHTIHCLAVRRDPRSLPALFHSPKVVLHPGDLTLPRFGLSEPAVSALFAAADALIHNAADVSFLKSYASLKPANFAATKELVRWCLPHRLSFHYISTASVANLSGRHIFDAESVAAFLPPSLSSSAPQVGYIATKWASERYLEKVTAAHGLPVWIHRPSSVTGDGCPDTDLMSNLLHYSRVMAAVPVTRRWSGVLDFVSADRVAMQIADEVYEDCACPPSAKYLFESGEREIPLADLKGVLEREAGRPFETLGMEEWVGRAEEKGLNPLVREYLLGIGGEGEEVVFPRLV